MSLRDEERTRRLLLRHLTQGGNAVNVAVTLAATTHAITFPRTESGDYGVTVTPSWGTTVWVTAKTDTGFTVNFGTAAPALATFDCTTFRTD